MRSNINIFFEEKYSLNKINIKNFVKKLAKHYKKNFFNLELNFVSIETIIKVNIDYLNHNYETDIITFNYSDNNENEINAEIFICPEIAKQNALKYRATFEEEIFRLLAHGILHIIGFKDETKSQKMIMRKKENEALSLFYLETNKK